MNLLPIIGPRGSTNRLVVLERIRTADKAVLGNRLGKDTLSGAATP